MANQQGLFLAKLLSGQITEPSKQQFTYHHRGMPSFEFHPKPRSLANMQVRYRVDDQHWWRRRHHRISSHKPDRPTSLASLEGILLAE